MKIKKMVFMNKLKFLIVVIIVSATVWAQIPVAVIDFNANGVPKDEVKALTDRFRNEMFNFGEYEMMERSFMEQILDEQGFQLSGCASDECVIEAGKLIGVEQMIGGSIGKIGNTYTVSVRIINVESGKIVNTASYDYEGQIDGLLRKGMREVAAILSGENIEGQNDLKSNLKITSNPESVSIFINDESHGVTPIVFKNIAPESYSIVLQKTHFFSIDTLVKVRYGENKVLNFQMMPDIDQINLKLSSLKMKRGIWLSGSVIAFTAGIYYKTLADEHYEDYENATDNAGNIHDQVIEEDLIYKSAFGVGAMCIIPVIKYCIGINKMKLKLDFASTNNRNQVGVIVGLNF